MPILIPSIFYKFMEFLLFLSPRFRTPAILQRRIVCTLILFGLRLPARRLVLTSASSNEPGHLQRLSRPLPLQLPRPAHTLSTSLLSHAPRLLRSRKRGLLIPQPRSIPTPLPQPRAMSSASPSTGQLLRPCQTANVLPRCARMLVFLAQTRIQISCRKACASWSPFPQTWTRLLVHSNRESILVTRG